MSILTKRPRLAAYIIAVLVLMISFITIHTQIIFNALAATGIAIPFALRLNGVIDNLVSMFVLWLIILGTAFTFSMIIAARIARKINKLPKLVHAFSGWAGIATTLLIMEWGGAAVIGVNIVVASRTMTGFLALTISGLLAGYVYRAFIEKYRT